MHANMVYVFSLLLLLATHKLRVSAVYDTEYYDILGVPPTATTQEINRAFKAKALVQHTDKGGDKEKFQQLRRAHEVLRNDEKRKIYDRCGKTGLKASEDVEQREWENAREGAITPAPTAYRYRDYGSHGNYRSRYGGSYRDYGSYGGRYNFPTPRPTYYPYSSRSYADYGGARHYSYSSYSYPTPRPTYYTYSSPRVRWRSVIIYIVACIAIIAIVIVCCIRKSRTNKKPPTPQQCKVLALNVPIGNNQQNLQPEGAQHTFRSH